MRRSANACVDTLRSTSIRFPKIRGAGGSGETDPTISNRACRRKVCLIPIVHPNDTNYTDVNEALANGLQVVLFYNFAKKANGENALKSSNAMAESLTTPDEAIRTLKDRYSSYLGTQLLVVAADPVSIAAMFHYGGISEGEIERRRRMRAALELALLDRVRASDDDSQGLYEKAFEVLQRMETKPGGWIAAQVARLVEETLGGRRRADEGRLVDRFLNDVNGGVYDR